MKSPSRPNPSSSFRVRPSKNLPKLVPSRTDSPRMARSVKRFSTAESPTSGSFKWSASVNTSSKAGSRVPENVGSTALRSPVSWTQGAKATCTRREDAGENNFSLYTAELRKKKANIYFESCRRLQRSLQRLSFFEQTHQDGQADVHIAIDHEVADVHDPFHVGAQHQSSEEERNGQGVLVFGAHDAHHSWQQEEEARGRRQRFQEGCQDRRDCSGKCSQGKVVPPPPQNEVCLSRNRHIHLTLHQLITAWRPRCIWHSRYMLSI